MISVMAAGNSCKTASSGTVERTFAQACKSIPNLHKLNTTIYSGGEPQGLPAFKALREMGVRTVVSVDGAKPDVESAHRCGIRYIHLPVGYGGIEVSKAIALGNVVRSVSGGVLVHCHHGKHRGPAAACIVAMGAGVMTAEQSMEFMKLAGTGRNYPGLWRDVGGFPSLKTDVNAAPYVERSTVDPFVESMGEMDQAMDRLQSLALQPGSMATSAQMAAAAQLLHEGFKESSRHLKSDVPDQLKSQLSEAEQAAERFQRDLAQGDLAASKAAIPALRARCVQCHQRFRDSEN